MIFWKRRTACYACGKLTLQPCKGHEYGSVLLVWVKRPWVPLWLASAFPPPKWHAVRVPSRQILVGWPGRR